MIQHINPRKTASAIAPMRQPAAADSPEQWGKWVGRNYYSLEMVQHPLRARMCGFGDKDRRPLAPAAVARMVVKRDDHSLVDVDDVDCSFFLVTVDLWSEDGKHERNLVLHPSSGDRYVPVQTPKQRRRGASSTAGPPRSGQQTPIPRSTPTPQFRGGDPPTTAGTGGFSSSNQGYFPAPASPFPPSSPYPASTPTWGYSSHGSPQVDRNTTYPPPILPSIHSFGRSSSVSSSSAGEPWNADPEPTYRPWNAGDSGSGGFGYPPADKSGGPDARDAHGHGAWEHSSRFAHDGPPYSSAPSTPQQYDPSLYAPAPYAQGQHPPPPPQQQQQAPYFSPPPNYQQHPPTPAAPSAAAANQRSAYTRTLVGPLSSNGYRLLDEHRKPGIFFLFQDLSVRTEGTFRLRLRLMNVGAPPAPEPGALHVHTNVSPVLAQIFTEPFTVYSAKRFPGVPETTALSIAFGNQGLKLPLVSLSFFLLLPRGTLTTPSQRNRHGSSKRRRDDSGSDDDSDGA
ncbi:velvet factor [Mycena rosella]|uniref:Velvet factor n=1 Tax=Mycena rosella TaxID=1033263 RepID=A0AAD7D9Q2_MYCRO|nr:velvet factor [Mycena rosella]